MKYIIGSRGSRLALIQTKYVQEKLAKAYPEHTFEIQIIKTKGDKIQNKPLDKMIQICAVYCMCPHRNFPSFLFLHLSADFYSAKIISYAFAKDYTDFKS